MSGPESTLLSLTFLNVHEPLPCSQTAGKIPVKPCKPANPYTASPSELLQAKVRHLKAVSTSEELAPEQPAVQSMLNQCEDKSQSSHHC